MVWLIRSSTPSEIGSGSVKGGEEEEDAGWVLVEFGVICGWPSPAGTMVRSADG